jgi:hypothetical protein
MKKQIMFVLCIYLANFCFALTGAKYLIITSDNYVSAVQPLADWKTKKGVKAMIVPTSVTGSSSSQIKNYITNAYNTWDIRPEYILIAGSSSSVPASGSSDDYYADMTGSFRIELSVGRFPCSSVSQIQNLVAKTLAYERTPDMSDSTWFIKGTTIVREDGSSPPDNVFWENVRYVHNFWRHCYYAQIDSFSSQRGNNSTNVTNAINNGRVFVLFRGESVTNWWSPFAMTPSNLTNGYKTPVVISGTCATASITSTGYLADQFVNAGTASSLKGAVGFFGTTVVASGPNLALNRGVVSKAFFDAVFGCGLHSMGDAAKYAKLIIDSTQPPSYSSVRYSEWQLFGDPELNIWTGIPQPLTLLYDTVITASPQTYTVTVRRGNNNLASALVCLMMDTTIYEYGRTNNSGEVTFTISPSVIGTMSLTVTAQNCLPYEKLVTIIAPGVNEGEVQPANLSNITLLNASKPNPMTNGFTQISYTISEPTNAALRIYDASGKLVKTLVDEFKSSGIYTVSWDGRDDINRKVAEGIYFYTLETPKQNLTKKLIFIQ